MSDVLALVPLSIPSPPASEWSVLGFPLRAYALCIMAGIVIGGWVAIRRWKARGGDPETMESVFLLAVPLGIIGARVYHVITDYQLYFGPGGDPLRALMIWRGGLGIWGAVAFGVVGALIVARRRGASFAAIADACAPGILIAQGIGRLGNYFNQELFGGPTTLPWGLEIDLIHRPEGYTQFTTFHPTFLYELLWNFAMAAVLLWADKRFTLGRGKVFTLYVVLYTLGRFWIEALRIDTVNQIGGFRLNNYTSAIVFVAALALFVYLCLKRPGRETVVDQTAVAAGDSEVTEDAVAADADGTADAADTADTERSTDTDGSTEIDTDDGERGQPAADESADEGSRSETPRR